MREKYTRILGFVATAISLSAYAIFAVSIYTLSTSFTAFTPAEGEEPPFRADFAIDLSTGAITITFSADVRNEGLLDISASLDLKLLSEDGEVIAEGSDLKQVFPGSVDELVVRMVISREDAERYSLETTKPSLSLFLGYRTFFNLIGMGISIEVPMGE